MVHYRSRPRWDRIGLCLGVILALLHGLPAFGQNTLTFGASVTTGNGTLTTDLTWATNPAIPTGTPCTASGAPSWTGAKAGSGTQSITISTSGTLPLTLSCTWPGGDTFVTYSWTNPTQNTDGSALTNLQTIRIKSGFVATLTSNPNIEAPGEIHTDVSQTPPLTTRTITGLTSTGTYRAVIFAKNALGVYSVASNEATKVFQAPVTRNQSVSITVNPQPQAATTLTAQ